VGADAHVGGHLDRTSLVVEEAEAVAAAGCLQGPGFADDPDAGAAQPCGEGVDIGGGGGAERDEVDPLVGRLPQPDDVLLR
jgi:hypothetical protein